jgi:serine/threonine protein kinase
MMIILLGCGKEGSRSTKGNVSLQHHYVHRYGSFCSYILIFSVIDKIKCFISLTTDLIESFVESSKLYIVMEHADGGDLSGAIAKRKAEAKYWVEDEIMRIFVQVRYDLTYYYIL